MARNRQRARERREARLAEQRASGEAVPDSPEAEATPDDGDSGIAPPGLEPEMGADLAASAPPEAIGRSDTAIDTDPPPQLADPELTPEAAASRGHLVDDRETRRRGKVAAFLVAVWAELQRVQWPNRQAMTSLTAVVLGFVVLAGGYLGLLDAIFSRLIQALL